MTPLQAWLVGRVKEGLREQGWTQARLAAEAGITQKHLSQMLTGATEGSLTKWSTLLSRIGQLPIQL